MIKKIASRSILTFSLMQLTFNSYAIDLNTKILDIKSSEFVSNIFGLRGFGANKIIFNDKIVIPRDNVSRMDTFRGETASKLFFNQISNYSFCSFYTDKSYRTRSIEVGSEYGVSLIKRLSDNTIMLEGFNILNIPSHIRLYCTIDNLEEATVGQLESDLKGILSID